MRRQGWLVASAAKDTDIILKRFVAFHNNFQKQQVFGLEKCCILFPVAVSSPLRQLPYGRFRGSLHFLRSIATFQVLIKCIEAALGAAKFPVVY